MSNDFVLERSQDGDLFSRRARMSELCKDRRYIPFLAVNQSPIISDKNLRVRHDPPVHAVQKLQLQQFQLSQTNPANPRIRGVVPECV
ncbi:hypothetical protein P8C59_007269 [Phyllachora maydis]|uniref:Uncharacterized protein n=1 Tax=Phyllachora maydis TaxID=1825666 RepID=A0AAD9I831_9PEZI|nr:hypothetical protein P8C59_007269 [Phyllachora maydis]